ncbi:MAG: hypothetical protein AAF192_11500, partial [Pseudomonadota bacterium]
MADFPETAAFVPVTQLEVTDVAIGGAGGASNRAPEQLTQRTAWLKTEVDQLTAAGAPQIGREHVRTPNTDR